MKTETCPWEEKLRKALAGGGPDRALRDHARQCPVCRDVFMVSAWMRKFRDLTLDSLQVHRPLPSWKEFWDRSPARPIDLQAANKALKPLFVFRKVAWFASAAAGVALLLLEFKNIKGLLASLPGIGQLAGFSEKTAESGGGALTQAIAVAGLGLAALVFLVLLTGIKGGDTRPQCPIPGK